MWYFFNYVFQSANRPHLFHNFVYTKCPHAIFHSSFSIIRIMFFFVIQIFLIYHFYEVERWLIWVRCNAMRCKFLCIKWLLTAFFCNKKNVNEFDYIHAQCQFVPQWKSGIWSKLVCVSVTEPTESKYMEIKWMGKKSVKIRMEIDTWFIYRGWDFSRK